MFDASTERLAHHLGLQVCFPPAALRSYLDSKVTTTRLANQAGVPSVPNVLARVESYDTLRRVAQALGPDLVVQLPYGDSGTSTFFISTEADFQPYAQQIAEPPVVKIMQRIRCRQLTIEGCVTRHGTLVGPLMTEMIGFGDLTPYRGGWCGNEVCAEGRRQRFPQKSASRRNTPRWRLATTSGRQASGAVSASTFCWTRTPGHCIWASSTRASPASPP